MKTHESRDIRNVGLIGHKASGKTSFAEAALWSAKVTNRLGNTSEGTSVLDFEPEAQKRVMSTAAALGSLPWKKHKINLIDGPGDANFLKETRLAMQAMDAVICFVSAKDGVEPMTERLLGWATDEFQLARAFFVSKMDVENSSFENALDDIKKNLCAQAVAVQLPIGAAATFRGVVDLMSQKAFLFQEGDGGQVKEAPIPDDVRAEAEEARNKLIEDIAAADEALMEKFFEGTLTPEEIALGLSKAMSQGLLVPVFCGSGVLNRGISFVLDFIVQSFPDPLSRPPRKGSSSGEAQTIERKPDNAGPIACLVFKTIVDQHAGRISVMRVLSGVATPDTTLKNGNRGKEERLGTLNSVLGKKIEAVERAETGDVFAVAKLKDTRTGDTLSSDGWVAETVPLPPPQISRAIRAKDKAAEDKVSAALQRIVDEDPGLVISRDEQTGEVLLNGSGQQHVEVAVEKLSRKFGVACELSIPRIPYRETFSTPVKNIEGKHKKQTGGHGQFGVCYLDVEPGERGSGFVFEDAIVGGAIPRQFIPSVEKGLHKAMAKGVLAGYPVVDIKIRLFDGKYHDVDSSDMSFQMAASKGLKSAVAKARPVLLEPIVNMTITVPEENVGDVMGDVNTRRGRVQGTDSAGRYTTVKAQMPLGEVQTYDATLRAMTQGRGSFTMEHSHYEQVPMQIQEKIVRDSGFVAVEED